MDDLISRQAAIDALERERTYSAVYKYGYTQTDYFKQYNMGLTDGIKALNKVPSAQPDSLVRPSARWMNVGHKRARICSSCFRDEPYKFADNDADVYDFCPHCGARMEVSE